MQLEVFLYMIKRLKFKARRKLKMMSLEIRFHKDRLLSKNSKKVKLKYLFHVLTRTCPRKKSGCGGGLAYLAHNNCAYVDELSNYSYCCKHCHDEIDMMYQEMWDEYWSGRL